MSGENDPARDHGDEQETWKDLFGSVFELADEVASRISPEEIEKRLKRTLRKAAGGAGTGTPAKPEPPKAGPPPASVSTRGPDTDPADARERASELCGSTLHLSLGTRSLTVTLDRPVERSAAGPLGWSKWATAGQFLAGGPRGVRRGRGRRPNPREPRWAGGDPPGLASFSARVPPGSFWAALGSAEREIFWRLAGEQSYPAGTALMREGETSNHVVVILEGRTEIWVRDGAADRMLASRGPGDLVGERAALQVSVRSATVVAVGAVSALVMRTQDFAAFISAHANVLKLIEDLIDKRLNEEPVQPGHGWDPRGLEPYGLSGPAPAWRPGPELHRLDQARCTVVATDVLGFGGPVRNDGDRRIVRTAMLQMTQSALRDMGEYLFEERGDGVLIIVPDAVPTRTIVQHLTEALPLALRRHNRLYSICAQIQMRIAVDTGLLESQGREVTGIAVHRALRLLEAPVLKTAISRSRANLGVIVSSSVYDTAIRPLGPPVGYGQVWIEEKGASQQAWMQMIDPAPERLAARV